MSLCSWKRLGRIIDRYSNDIVPRGRKRERWKEDGGNSQRRWPLWITREEGGDAWPATYYPPGSRNSTPENDCIQIIPPFSRLRSWPGHTRHFNTQITQRKYGRIYASHGLENNDDISGDYTADFFPLPSDSEECFVIEGRISCWALKSNEISYSIIFDIIFWTPASFQ